MRTSIRNLIVVAFAVALLLVADALSAKPRRGRDAPPQMDSRLDRDTQNALLASLDDERKSQAFYNAVLDRHGDVRPFSNIVHAEGRHAEAILALMEKYGVAAQPDKWAEHKFDVPRSLADARRQAAELERENIAMYNQFLKFVKPDDIRNVMTHLRDASEQHHLPAFEGGRGGGGCGGQGCGRGNGWRGGR